MFRYSWTEKAEFAGTIPTKDGIWGLGPFTDANGMKWDIHGIFGYNKEQWVQACPLSNLHPYYYNTSNQSYGFVQQTWEPYRVEIIKSE